MSNTNIGITTEVFAILRNEETGEETRYTGHNLISNHGLTYYARMASNETITDAVSDPQFYDVTKCSATVFDGTTAPAAGADLSAIWAERITDSGGAATVALASGYPKTNDTDTQNTGTTDVYTVSYKFNWPSGAGTNFSGAAKDIAIHHTSATGVAGDELLMHAEFDATGITKGTADSLTVFVNHTFSYTP